MNIKIRNLYSRAINTIDIHGRSQNLHYLYSSMGLKIGGIRVFPVIRQVRMYCGLSTKMDKRETPNSVQRLRMHFVCVSFRVCGQ